MIPTVFLSLVVLATIGAVCGVPADRNRIVGGQLANDTQMPYQVALFYDGKFRCGGSIVSARHVLTAAHCVVDGGKVLDASLMAVHAGSASLDDGGSLYMVAKAHPHEKYTMVRHDVAVLEMAQDFVFDAYTHPIELMEEELPLGSEVVISGYGRVGDGLPPSGVLLYNTMYVVSDLFCSLVSGVLRTGLICLNKDGPHGACNGDSGGPAVYEGRLVGVANFIRDHCGGDYPDGYAKVSFYVDWVRKFLV